MSKKVTRCKSCRGVIIYSDTENEPELCLYCRLDKYGYEYEGGEENNEIFHDK